MIHKIYKMQKRTMSLFARSAPDARSLLSLVNLVNPGPTCPS